MNIIEFKNINLAYTHDQLVLKDINLSIKRGEHWAILGANGSGKSTLLKLFSNDLYPHTGNPFTKKLFDQDNWEIIRLKKHLGIVTNELENEYRFNSGFSSGFELIISSYFSSIGKQLHHHYTSKQKDATQKLMEDLEIVHLKNKKILHMSTGELRRCIIARALLHKPEALLLDEPTTGLDVKSQIKFLELIKTLSHQITLIIITHHIEEIIPQVTHVALMADRTIYKQGKKEDILNAKNLSKIFDIPLELEEKDEYYTIRRKK
jgi:iron complex transport system ATP-binding protein